MNFVTKLVKTAIAAAVIWVVISTHNTDAEMLAKCYLMC